MYETDVRLRSAVQVLTATCKNASGSGQESHVCADNNTDGQLQAAETAMLHFDNIDTLVQAHDGAALLTSLGTNLVMTPRLPLTSIRSLLVSSRFLSSITWAPAYVSSKTYDNLPPEKTAEASASLYGQCEMCINGFRRQQKDQNEALVRNLMSLQTAMARHNSLL